MDADEVLEAEIDHKGFKITVEVLNPDYLIGKVKQTESVYGGGYLLFVTKEEGITVAKHGYVHLLQTAHSMTEAASSVNALPTVIASTVECILRDKRADLAELYLKGAEALRAMLKLQEGP